MKRKIVGLSLGIIGLAVVGGIVGSIIHSNVKNKKSKKEDDDFDDDFDEFDDCFDELDDNKHKYIKIYTVDDKNEDKDYSDDNDNVNKDSIKDIDNTNVFSKLETNIEEDCCNKDFEKYKVDKCEDIETCNETQITLHDLYPNDIPPVLEKTTEDIVNEKEVVSDDNIKGQLSIADVFPKETSEFEQSNTNIDTTCNLKPSVEEMDIDTERILLRSEKEDIVVKRVALKAALDNEEISKETYYEELSLLGQREKEINEKLSTLKKK